MVNVEACGVDIYGRSVIPALYRAIGADATWMMDVIIDMSFLTFVFSKLLLHYMTNSCYVNIFSFPVRRLFLFEPGSRTEAKWTSAS